MSRFKNSLNRSISPVHSLKSPPLMIAARCYTFSPKPITLSSINGCLDASSDSRFELGRPSSTRIPSACSMTKIVLPVEAKGNDVFLRKRRKQRRTRRAFSIASSRRRQSGPAPGRESPQRQKHWVDRRQKTFSRLRNRGPASRDEIRINRYIGN